MNRKLSYIFLVILIGVAIIGFVNSPGETREQKVTEVAQASPSITPTASPTPTPVAEAEASISNTNLKMGQEFKLGDFDYKIVNAVAVRGLTRSYQQPLRAADGATFIIVDYVIRNDGTKSDDMWATGFKIEDSKGRQFETSSEIETEIEMQSKTRNDMFVKQLQPGVSRKFRAGFEIPTDALNQPLVLAIPERGFFSSGTTKVELVVTKWTKKEAAKANHR